ncbi:cytochrome c [Simiduia sp. 21SJ11W-1]|uniref:c-type cytochrome n=1 Tax=Simiduia sp. 21SJ11W-1 TaxID=2909669 RepID=UPI00209F63B3|nr:cytochrome c [Simiduia sp. 21SJ11W-1]UTA48164.1 cytochrome c [Simiduia sp. 21SJ11W-1]
MTSWIKKIAGLRWLRWLLGIAVALAGVIIMAFVYIVESSKALQPPEEVTDKTVYLKQHWDSTARDTYYYTPQGTSVPQGANLGALRYSWFVNLEMPLSTERFAAPGNMRRFKFLVDPAPSTANPDHLPVGFTKHFNTDLGEDVLDITCAACHTGELHYKKGDVNYAVRVDGGQAMHAFTDLNRGTFGPTLITALLETWANPVKFDRFADKVLADGGDRGALKTQLGHSLKAFLGIKQNNPLKHLYPTREGYGRTDALGRIANTLFGDHLIESNMQVGNAPVSYPYLWNIWKFNWVQYNGSVSQPLARNIGEALGVGAVIPLMNPEGGPLPAHARFRSSVRIPDIERIEHTLQTLQEPEWPAEIFGEPDAALAAQGKALFENHCVECHGPHRATAARMRAEAPLKTTTEDQWLIEVIDLDHIGTDPNAARGFLDKTYDLTPAGIDRATIKAVLTPLFDKQLARDVLARLEALAEADEQAGIVDSPFAQLAANYPDPDQLALNDFHDAPFEAIRSALQASNYLPSKKVNANYQPYRQLGCSTQCQVNALWWDIDYGRAAVAKKLDALDPKALTEGVGLNVVGLLIKARYYEDNQLSHEQIQCLEGFGTLDLPQQIAGYKPRPLAGVWATPPFLHNGSVPNIYQMLTPPEERDKRFFVGRRDYDPVHLGYVTSPASGRETDGMWFDTSITGNHNTGHGFSASKQQWAAYKADYKANPLPKGVIGPVLSHEQRMALIEYLKVHRDNPEGYQFVPGNTCLASYR